MPKLTFVFLTVALCWTQVAYCQVGVNHNIAVPRYKPTRIYVTPTDYVDLNTYVRSNFVDQFLEVENSDLVFPASRIFGFERDSGYYRSASLSNRDHVFVKQSTRGSMSLFMTRNPYRTAGEWEVIGSDGNGGTYRNAMILSDANGKRFADDYSYFIVLDEDTSQLILVNVKTFGDLYLKDCKRAEKVMSHFRPRAQWLGRSLLIGSVGVLFYGLIVKPRSQFPKGHPARIWWAVPMIALPVGYFAYRLVTRTKRLTPERMEQVITIYNDDCG